jgi:hypothetical protein
VAAEAAEGEVVEAAAWEVEEDSVAAAVLVLHQDRV